MILENKRIPVCRLLFTLLYLLLLPVAKAVPLCRIEFYDEGKGLTQQHVTQMLQDPQGMIWFSTWNGLCRYDGYSFCGFKAHVGDGSPLATDRIRSIWLTEDGNIGCKVDEDYYLFNRNTCRFEYAKSLQPGRKQTVSVKDNKPYRYKNTDGVVWTLYHDGTLTYTQPGGSETVYDAHPRIEAAHFCLLDRQKQLWVIADYGVYKLTFLHQHANISRSPQRNETKAMMQDRNGCCWIASKERATVALYDAHHQLSGYLSAQGKLSSAVTPFAAPVYCMVQTHDGTVWLGCKPGGLFRLRKRTGGSGFSVDRISHLPCNDVYDLCEDRWHRLWIATLGGGIASVVNPSAAVPQVISVDKGLPYCPKRKALKVRRLFIAPHDVMLAATTEGLVVTRLLSNKQLSAMRFRLHTREPDRRDALSCSATMNIAADSKGRLYVSTESGGVNRIETRQLLSARLSFRHYGKESGWPTDVVQSVMPMGGKMLAVSSNQLVLFDADSGASTSFGQRFFQSVCRFSDAQPLRLPGGRWLFGLQDGTLAIHQSRLRKSGYVPNIAFTGMSVQGKELCLAVNALDTVVLQPTERSLTATFAALDYMPDGDIRYAFCLRKEGDEAPFRWNYIGHDHSATLLDLLPGTYTLWVRSTNADGVWGNNSRRLTIEVTPAFAETTIAHVLLMLLFLFMVSAIGYTVVYIRRIRRQRREALDAYLSLLPTSDPSAVVVAASVKPQLSSEDDVLMRRVSAFVEAHIADADVSVSQMADAAAVSRSGLQRKMKQMLGVTPLDFLREARIKHACQLLVTTNMSVSDVAYACGFSDPKYFSRCFKASTGHSPSAYKDTVK